MNRMLNLLGISIAVCVLPQMANAQTLTLDPGLYDYSHSFTVAGGELPGQSYEYCLREGENSKTLDELVATLSDGAECSVTNVSMTSTTGRADVSCSDTGLGMDISGRIDAKFGPDFYDVDTQAKLGQFIPMQVKTKVRRRGACPIKSDTPNDVSGD